MKILEIILDNRLGGISVRALAAAEGLAARGVETHFLLPTEPGDVHEKARARGVAAHRAFMPRPNPRRPIRSLLWLLMIPVNTLQIRRIIRAHGIDAIHVNGLLNVPGFLAAKLCAVPLIWHLAGTSMYPKPVVHLFRPLLKRATVLVCIAGAVRDYFLGEGRDAYSYRIIHEPVTFNISPAPEKRAFRETLGVPDGAYLVVTVGNVSPVKGLLYGIRAIEILARAHPQIHYLIVGQLLETQQEHFEMLEREIAGRNLQGRVTFAGKRTDVSNILSVADAFLLSSVSEGTPISILEAMSVNLPVVASAVGGIPEQIEHEVSGLLVEPRNPNAIAEAVSRYVEEPVFAGACAERARETVLTQFSLSGFLDQFDGLLAEFVGTRKPPCDG